MTWRAAFLGQAESCAALGSPFTARLLRLLAAGGLPDWAVRDRIATWPGGQTHRPGRADFHGHWINRTAPPPEDVRW